MELTDLKIFISIVEEGSATRAASRLAMTQPGVSQHLASLEGEIGGKLFVRKGKRLELNDFGRLFLGRAKKLIEDAEALKNLVKGGAAPTGSLKLGLTDSSTLTVIPPALARFRSKYPHVQVSLDVHDSNDIEEGVIRGYYDLGVVTVGLRSHPSLDEQILYYDRIDAIVSKTHPFAKKKRISLELLASGPLLLYPRRSRTRQIIDDGLYARNIFPKEIIEVYNNTAAVRLAESGIGAALLSQAFITQEMPKHRCVHLRITGDPFKRPICVARKRDGELSAAAVCFYEMLFRSPPLCCALSSSKGKGRARVG